MSSSTASTIHHHQAMPNCLLILLLTLPTTTRVAGTNSHLNITQKPGGTKGCNATSHQPSCLVSVNRTNIIDNSTLTQGDSISYGGSLVSENGTFKLGFFDGGGNTYLGIWYNYNGTKVIVWVANRDNPIPSQRQQHNLSLVLGRDDGIARLLDSNKRSYWSTPGNYPLLGSLQGQTIVLQLERNGNLILKVERGTKSVELWQSFENPTDTLLKGQLAYFNTSTAPSLTSWEGHDNPAYGSYIIQIESYKGHMVLSIKRNNTPYWVSTNTSGSSSSFPTELTRFLDGTPAAGNSSMRLVLNSSGMIQLWVLDNDSAGRNYWSIFWSAPKDQCHLYETCGSFGVCDAHNRFMCKCLPGFMPISNALGSGEFTGDCTKRTTDTSGHKFLRLPMINLPSNIPDRETKTQTEEECENDCLKDSACKAYSFDPDPDPRNSICQLWNKDLYNIQEEYYDPGNRTLFIRVSPSDIDFGKSACEICGTNVIPYPLSTNFNCGDSNYMSFECNSSNGQVYFSPVPIGNYTYKVSHINEAAMKFVVQLPQHKCDTVYNIESKLFNLGNSSPFSVIDCMVVHLIGGLVAAEVEMSWKPPAPPPCIASSDCNYWPNTSCYDRKVCKCANGFHSDFEFLNCTKVDHKEMSLAIKAGIASTCGIVFLLGIIFCILHLRKKKATHRLGITEINKDNDIEDIDIPFVDYESILYATDNFSDANKLGVGGFGPVYKGNLADGNAIAVKRLSAASKQGIEEFRNEVLLIAKLQHRNLVRVLGYCIKENEKILIYEYMPNKSLDAFLFDQTLSPLLDWIKRFNIIMGIARGLLYLHQDSRLRIIHRDLKPSNILLDEDLNPKISDFGLARIVAGNEMTTNSTAKVIGTQGYMSPEYALDGHFSIKSDVYSFGVVVLEIISGKRCTGLLHFDNSLISLLGYAWSLWDKGSPFELVDRSVDSYDSVGVKRCINVGLLCVQEDPSDRPTMSNVLLMLGGENMDLSCPKKPAFIARRKPPSEASTSSSSNKLGISSNIELTVTIEGR